MIKNVRVICIACMIVAIALLGLLYGPNLLQPQSTAPSEINVEPLANRTLDAIPYSIVKNSSELFYPIKVSGNVSKNFSLKEGRIIAVIFTKENISFSIYDTVSHFEMSLTIVKKIDGRQYCQKSNGPIGECDGERSEHIDLIGTRTYLINMTGNGYFIFLNHNIFTNHDGSASFKFNAGLVVPLSSKYTSFFFPTSHSNFIIDYSAKKYISIIAFDIKFQKINEIINSSAGQIKCHYDNPSSYFSNSIIVIKSESPQNISLKIISPQKKWYELITEETIALTVALSGIIIASIIAYYIVGLKHGIK
jgi:hypothetical protein